MNAHAIALDQTIEQVVCDQPGTIPVFLTYRLACVGCYMALFCTLEDAVTTYNLPREQFLADLQHAASARLESSVEGAAPDARGRNKDECMKTLDVREIAPRQRHQLIFETFGSLQPGEAFILVNDHDPKPLYYQFNAEQAGQFTWEYLEQGPETWRVRVGKSAPAT
jgi:hybrid cluster-associated redox disulfide protein